MAVFRNLSGWSFIWFLATWTMSPACAQTPASEDSLTTELAHTTTDTTRVNLLLSLAQVYRDGDAAKQFAYANEALALAGKTQWTKGAMRAEEDLGECYIKLLAYHDALGHFLRSITEAKKINDRQHERACLQYMVHCYHMLDSLEPAATYQKRLLDLTAQTGNRLAEYNQMSAYADRLSDLGRYPESISWLQQDVGIARKRFPGRQSSDMIATLLSKMALVYARIRKTDSALFCLRTANALARETGNDTAVAYIISGFCDVYAAAKKYDSAIWYGRQALQAGRLLNDLPDQQQYARMLSGLYTDEHQPAAALQYHLIYDSLSAVINNTRQTIDQAMQVAKINMEQQAAMNGLEKQSLQATKKAGQIALAGALTVLVAVLGLTLIIYRSLRQKQKSNRIIREQAGSLRRQNEQIDTALKAKELMLKETHHRIKNNLQLISSLLELQVTGMDDAPARDALRTAQRRIQSIATVHTRLYGSSEDERIEFSAFVQDLFTRLSHAFSTDGCMVRFDNAVPPAMLPLDIVVQLGLILNELITNTFKYACDGVIVPAIGITLTGTGDAYTLEYHDNGPGLPREKFDAPAGSMGLYLVKRMSLQLKGTANYIYDGRSRFIISFRTGR